MSRHLTAFALTVLGTLSAWAYNITGTVFNTSENAPEPYATLRFYSQADTSKTVKAATSGASGSFNVPIARNGDYTVVVTAVGNMPATVKFKVEGKNVDLGRITLHTDTTSLGEVTVTALKPIIKREIDRLSYDVKADDEASTSNILDILRKVPMVSVDGQNNITVKGSSNFKVYKNGRPNKAFSSNAKDIFEAIPASSIKRIEVITDPGAREDAEGSSAILNIVTDEESSLTGITGTASMSIDNLSLTPSPNLYLTGQINKVMLSGYGGINRITKDRSLYDSESEATFDQTGDTRRSKGSSWSKGWSEWFGVESSWEPDTLNLATLELNGWNNNSRHTSHTTYTTIHGEDPVMKYTQNTISPKSDYFSTSATANYQRSTHLKGETITLSYQFSYEKSDNRSQTTYSDMENFNEPYSAINSKSSRRQNEHTVQLDWSRPYGQHHKLDLGGKYIFREARSRSEQEYVDAFNSSDDFRHRTQVGAVYADYRMTFGRWNARAGLRYEYSELSARFFHSDKKPFSSTLHDVVPNVAVSWNINDANTLKMSYSTSINRPGIWGLDPTVTITPNSISSGNPDLKSSRNNGVSLEYSLSKSKLYLEAQIGYQFSRDQISGTQRVNDENVIISSYGNVCSFDVLMYSLYTQWTLSPKTSFMLNLNGAYGKVAYPSENISVTRFLIWPYARISQELPWKLKLTAQANWSSGNLNSVYSYQTGGTPWYSLSLQRSFLKENRLTVRLWASNIFGPYTSRWPRTHYTNTSYTGYAQSFDPRAAMVSLNVSYRFGNLKSQVKKVNKSITNDDLKGGGGNNSSSK